MPNNSRKSTKDILYSSLGVLIIISSTLAGLTILWKECSPLISKDLIYPSAWR